MSVTNDDNEIRGMEGHKPVPRGFLLFLFALVAWGAWYLWSYTPQLSGWSAYKEFEAQKGAAPAGAPSPVAAATGNPYAGNAKAVEEGEAIYRKECAGCHGDDMKNPSGGPDLRAALKYGSDAPTLFETVSKGRPGGMPDFAAALGTDRTWKVVGYVLHERGGK
jgi:mono/diheme cytochrome c family protein